MEVPSLSMASTGSSGCKSQKVRLGVEAVFFSEKSRLPTEAVVWHQRCLWTVTGVIDPPLVVSPGDHLKSLPTFFFNDLYEIQYFGICIWINPELVHSIPPSIPSSFLLLLCWWAPTEGGWCFGHCVLPSLLCGWSLPNSKRVHLWLWARGLEAQGQRLMCSTILKRFGQHLPGIQESNTSRAALGLRPSQHQPPAWASLGQARESFYYGKGIFLKTWYIEYIYIFTHFYWKWKFYYGNLV